MEERSSGVVSISDLIRRSRPVTGAFSLNSCSPPSSSRINPRPQQSDDKPFKPSDSTSPKTLKPLSHPTILIGTLNLPTHHNLSTSTSNSAFVCPKISCLCFSDDSSTVCCDILGLHPRILGKKIRILAWNFIPFKSGGGFLEIIKWGLPEFSGAPIPCSLNSESFPLSPCCSISRQENCNARYYAHGLLESVSPVTVVPCTIGVKNDNGASLLSGFLSQILVCECKFCSSKDSLKALHYINKGNSIHHFTKPLIVYFCDFASRWHPMISTLVGNVISLSGLKKKLVYIGKEDSQLLYVTTEKTLLSLPRLRNQCLSLHKADIEGKGECGIYTGTITGIYMQGTVVEFDQEVMLLLTDQQLNPTHGLRVGAIVCVRNVHFVNPKFSWTKTLILGACFKTSIHVKSFSTLETGCHMYSKSQSLLGKFIESLSFSARLWVLLIVSCLKKTFSGILSEEDILGSKHKQGLTQKYCSSCLPLSVIRPRHGVFREYCKHDSCGCGFEPNCAQLKLVVPISNFISHCEGTWIKMISLKEPDSDITGTRNQNNPCEWISVNQPTKRFLKSEDTDFVLLGNLKNSSSSGSLQLVDATGSIDIVIPDLPLAWSMNSIYQVYDFTVVMEGTSNRANHLESLSSESFSCRNVFNNFLFVKERKLSIYLYCWLRDKDSRNRPFCTGPHCNWKFEELSGRFHMLYVTHKFPVLQQLQGDQVIRKRSSNFAEAIVLPLDMFLSEKDKDYKSTISDAHSGDLMEFNAASLEERAKSCKSIQASSTTLRSCPSDAENGGSSNYCAYVEDYGEKSYPCFVACRSVNCYCLTYSESSFHCKTAKMSVNSSIKSGGQKVLLEFEPDSFYKLELLRIGCHYMTKHHGEDVFCNIKCSKYCSSKIVIDSRTSLLSFSFSSDEALKRIGQAVLPQIHDSFFSNKAVLSEDSHQINLPSLQFMDACPQLVSDIHIFSPSDSLNFLEENLYLLVQGFVKPFVSFEELTCISKCLIESLKSTGISSSDCLLPEGNLISLHGHVIALNRCSFAAHTSHNSSTDEHVPRFLKELTRSVCIHVSIHNHMVRIFGSSSKNNFPIAFGAGVNATFHRVLVLGRQNELLLTPASFVVINSVMAVNDQTESKSDGPSAALGFDTSAFPEAGLVSLVSDMEHCLDHRLLRLQCKVVALYVLVLEDNTNAVRPHPRIRSSSPFVNIPLAGFVVDDGSSPCCCWANNERAATLLRCREGNLFEARGRSSRRPKKSRRINARSTIINRVDKILLQHGRVVMKNYGSVFDSSCQDLAISGSSDKIISCSDEEFLKFNILNSCFTGTFWTVVGSVMDSDATERLEKHLMTVDMPKLPLRNIWATEVLYSDPVIEARNIIEELNMKQA